MSDVIKSVYFVKCENCGNYTISQFETDFMSKREFLTDITRGGWLMVKQGPLCPKCAEAYKKAVEETKKKQEEAAKLKKAAEDAAKLKKAAEDAAKAQAESGEESVEPTEAPTE